jgi:hypothetical protein
VQAPECFTAGGVAGHKVSEKSDVYSLAVIMWEMLTGDDVRMYDYDQPLVAQQACVYVLLSGFHSSRALRIAEQQAGRLARGCAKSGSAITAGLTCAGCTLRGSGAAAGAGVPPLHNALNGSMHGPHCPVSAKRTP